MGILGIVFGCTNCLDISLRWHLGGCSPGCPTPFPYGPPSPTSLLFYHTFPALSKMRGTSILGSKLLKCSNARSVCATRYYVPVGEEILNSHVHLEASLLSLHLVLFLLEILNVKASMNNRTQNRNKKHFCPALLSIQKTMVLICYPNTGMGKLTKPNCSQTFQQRPISSPSSPIKACPVLLGHMH